MRTPFVMRSNNHRPLSWAFTLVELVAIAIDENRLWLMSAWLAFLGILAQISVEWVRDYRSRTRDSKPLVGWP